MGKFDLKVDTDEGSKWPLVLGAVVIAAAVATVFTYPEKVGSLFEKVAEWLPSKSHKEQVASAQGSSHAACIGLFVWNCKADHSVTQNNQPEKEPEAPVDVKAKVAPAQPTAPMVAHSDTDIGAQKQKVEEKPKKKAPTNAIARTTTPTYQSIGPNDDLNLLGMDRFKPTLGLCAFKMYLPCYMPPGFGAETIVRERD